MNVDHLLHSGLLLPTERIPTLRYFSPALVAGFTLIAGSFTQAQTATGSLAVSAEVTRTCTLSAEPLTFGALSVDEVNTASAVISLECNSPSVVATILVGMGDNQKANERNMSDGLDANNLTPYTLHVSETGSVDLAPEVAVPLVRDRKKNTYNATLYGEVQPSADYQTGSYSDMVVLTATYAVLGQ